MRIEDCGKKSVLFRDAMTGIYFGTLVMCKDYKCETCRERASEYLRETIAYYADVHQLRYFVTLTTGEKTAKELSEMYSDLMDELKKLERSYYFNWYRKSEASRKNHSDEKVQLAYEVFVHEAYYGHYFLTWFHGLDENNRGQYVPSVDIGIKLHKTLQGRSRDIKKFIKSVLHDKSGRKPRDTSVDDYYEKNIKPHIKKWTKYLLYQDIRAEGKTREFARDFNIFITDIALNIFKTKIFNEEYFEELKQKLPPEGLELTFIRVFEVHKEGLASGVPHIHALINYMVPHSIVKKIFGDYIYDLRELDQPQTGVESKDLKDLDKNKYHDSAQVAAEYISKYFEKTLLDMMLDESMGKVDVISSSHNIQLRITDAFKRMDEAETHWEFVKVSDGVLRNGKTGKFNTVQEFESGLIPPTLEEHPNEHIQEMRIAYRDHFEKVSQKGLKAPEREKMKEAINEKYVDLHDKALAVELERRRGISYPAIPTKRKVPSRGKLSDEQYRAVSGLLFEKYGMGFLVGYAGSGKTFTLSQIVNEIDLEKCKLAIVSFTARAVARTKDMMNKNGIDFNKISVETIHKLCSSKFARKIDYPLFYNDWEKPLEYDVIIIDEYSMIGIELLVNFLAAINPKTKIIFVGDEAQLNPVKSKNPKHYLIPPETVFPEYPVYELTKNYRSGEEVADRANEVRNGDLNKIEFVPFSWETIEKEKKDGARILSNSNALSADVNHHFQQNKTDITLRYKYNIFDGIMLTRNDPYKRYVNGEFGKIIGFTDDKISIQLEKGNLVDLTYPKFRSSVVPDHAMTVHKAQGSEFENVLIIIDSSLTNLTNLNILYTGITRATRKFTVMITEEMTEGTLKKLAEPQQ